MRWFGLIDGVKDSPMEDPRTQDQMMMHEAVVAGQSVRGTTSPNPWVGCVIVSSEDHMVVGATQPPGGPHAEIEALRLAGPAARGATMYVTLEPCAHHGRTPPCVGAIVAAGIKRVVVGVLDPDTKVNGEGVAYLQGAGIETTVVDSEEVQTCLAPYLKHRATGRPWVILKLAASLDGRIAAPDGQSSWITGPAARADVHLLRSESDAILVGAGTVRVDNPQLTVREVPGSDPLRIVLGKIPNDALVLPALSRSGPLAPLLDELGKMDVIQLLVEGGAQVAAAFHHANLIDQYVFYYAPALFGGEDAKAMFAGPGVPTMHDLWRGHITAIKRLGDDLRIDLAPPAQGHSANPL